MYNAVPAIGRVRSEAIRATPHHHACGLRKSSPLNCQQARSNKKIEPNSNASKMTSRGKCVMRTEPATKFGKRVKCAWEEKNSELKGNNSGRNIFSTPGRY